MLDFTEILILFLAIKNPIPVNGIPYIIKLNSQEYTKSISLNPYLIIGKSENTPLKFEYTTRHTIPKAITIFNIYLQLYIRYMITIESIKATKYQYGPGPIIKNLLNSSATIFRTEAELFALIYDTIT